MRIGRGRIFGLTIGAKLMILSLAFLTIPAIGYWSTREMKSFLMAGQENAQLLTAQAVATILHNRDDLFEAGYGPGSSIKDEGGLYVSPLDSMIQIDGYSNDWGGLPARSKEYGKESLVSVKTGGQSATVSFNLTLGLRGEYIYALVRVTDDEVIYRHPDYISLSDSDHLRLAALARDGNERRIIITAKKPGAVSAYQVDAKWKLPITGAAENDILGIWRESSTGYIVELRFPKNSLDSAMKLGVAVGDVDDESARKLESVVGAVEKGKSDRLNLVFIRSPELERIIQGLDLSGARIWIIDGARRVRADVGGSLEDDIAHGTESRNEEVIQKALVGAPGVERRKSEYGYTEVIMAAAPVLYNGKVMGAVLIEQSTDRIQALQRETLERVFGITLFVFVIVTAGLFIFSSQLTWRIHRLRDEAENAIDNDGRVVYETLRTDRSAGDEMGDLSRGISALLSRLRRYTMFLERMPRSLNHEISNPLNTISTSLQNLEQENPTAAKSQYFQSAGHGVDRLRDIVKGLTEAANLEQALKNEEMIEFDLGLLAERYVKNLSAKFSDRRFTLSKQERAYFIKGSDFQIEQLLDKLIDNAIDFSPENSEIIVGLRAEEGAALLTVANEGPRLPESNVDQLFESMVSERGPGSGSRLHLGMGLYVVRVIAQSHGGGVEARNRPGAKGVEFIVRIPLQGGV